MAIETIDSGQVHRFRDLVAVRLGTGETVYLTEGQAEAIAKAIATAAKSIRTESFALSTCGTFTLNGREG